MLNVALARIGQLEGNPKKLAAQVLYKLMVDEDAHAVDMNEDPSSADPRNYFETLVVSNGNTLNMDTPKYRADTLDSDH